MVTITIDRPARRNALDLEHFDALAGAWKRFRDDADAWVAIVTGVDDAFCAGGDLRDYLPQLTEALATGSPEDRARFRSGTEAVLRDLEIYKPIIAAVNGPCVAGGMELLNGTDIRLACPEAVFGMVEPKRGIFASGGTSVRLPRQIPWAAAMEFLLTAEPVPATRAMEMGLLNEIVSRVVCSSGRFQEWAARITENAPLAVAATKESAAAMGSPPSHWPTRCGSNPASVHEYSPATTRGEGPRARSPKSARRISTWHREWHLARDDHHRDRTCRRRLVGVIAVPVDRIHQVPEPHVVSVLGSDDGAVALVLLVGANLHVDRTVSLRVEQPGRWLVVPTVRRDDDTAAASTRRSDGVVGVDEH